MPVVPAGQRQCSAKTASGGHADAQGGNAAHPAKGDYVLVNYIGYLAADGRVFDQNGGRLSGGRVIPAFPKACN
jgi:FKBP-type peptidyl-prolyl cis-trans isomerase FkpA